MSFDYRKNRDKYSDTVKVSKTDRGRTPLWVRKRQSVKSLILYNKKVIKGKPRKPNHTNNKKH